MTDMMKQEDWPQRKVKVKLEESNSQRGGKLAGRTLIKAFPGFGKFRGSVVKYLPKEHFYKVKYEDGDEEELEEDELMDLLIPEIKVDEEHHVAQNGMQGSRVQTAKPLKAMVPEIKVEEEHKMAQNGIRSGTQTAKPLKAMVPEIKVEEEHDIAQNGIRRSRVQTAKPLKAMVPEIKVEEEHNMTQNGIRRSRVQSAKPLKAMVPEIKVEEEHNMAQNGIRSSRVQTAKPLKASATPDKTPRNTTASGAPSESITVKSEAETETKLIMTSGTAKVTVKEEPAEPEGEDITVREIAPSAGSEPCTASRRQGLQERNTLSAEKRKTRKEYEESTSRQEEELEVWEQRYSSCRHENKRKKLAKQKGEEVPAAHSGPRREEDGGTRKPGESWPGWKELGWDDLDQIDLKSGVLVLKHNANAVFEHTVNAGNSFHGEQLFDTMRSGQSQHLLMT